MTVLRASLQEIYAPIESDLRDFSAKFEEALVSKDPLIQGIHQHLLKMTGKFLRPALVILSWRLEGGARREDVLRLAAAIELIHTATLIHDDIIDNSELRRNQPSVYSKWGREISIVSGDYLYAKAFLNLAALKDIWINQAFAACAEVICEGEMKQIERRNFFMMGEEEYLRIIHQKTAALFQASCMGGSYLSGASRENIQRLGDYGLKLGMAFQIVDDCLDVVGETENLGKTVGLDLYKNDVTLPFLYLFQSLKAADQAEMERQMKSGGGRELFEKIKGLALERGCVDRAMDKARGYIQGALLDLKAVRDCDGKESLVLLSHHCLERAR